MITWEYQNINIHNILQLVSTAYQLITKYNTILYTNKLDKS